MKNFIFILICFELLISCSSKSNQYTRPKRQYSVDTSIDPCQDFHAYVCNSTEKEFKLPDDRPAYMFAFSDSIEAILGYKKKYFAGLATTKVTDSREEKLKNLYLACMNPSAVKEDELAYNAKIKTELADINSRLQLQKYLSGKMLKGDVSFIEHGVIRNMDNSFYYDSVFVPTTLTYPEKTYYLRPELKSDLISLFKTFFKAQGVTNYDLRAEQLFAFESQLAKVYPSPLELRDLMNKRTKVRKSELLNLKNLALHEVLKKVTPNTHIRSIAPQALIYLNDQLGKLDINQLKDFYLYYSLHDYLIESQPEFFAQYFKLKAKYMGGPSSRPSLEERCTTYVMEKFPMELDAILFPRIFPNFPSEKVVHLAEEIRNSILDSLKEDMWLSEKAKAGAIKKMKSAELMLVSPRNEVEWNFNPETNVSPTKMLSNTLALNAALKQRDFNELGTKVPKERWGKGPLEVNAYYSPAFNHFVLPVAILQTPFFDDEQSREQNLAAIGTVIGHELGHGIDDKGYLYDEQGRLRSWVTTTDKKGLESRSHPLIDMFNKVGHNGRLTLGENTGDNVGLSASFRAAFPKYQPGKYPVTKLKEFFLQYGRVWCEVQTDSFREMRLKVDPHSLGKERINQQVKQQGGFSDAYSCKEGDGMYLSPKERVKIW